MPGRMQGAGGPWLLGQEEGGDVLSRQAGYQEQGGGRCWLPVDLLQVVVAPNVA